MVSIYHKYGVKGSKLRTSAGTPKSAEGAAVEKVKESASHHVPMHMFKKVPLDVTYSHLFFPPTTHRQTNHCNRLIEHEKIEQENAYHQN